MTDERTEVLKCKHAWKNISSKRQTVYQCEACGIYTFEQPANQVDDIDVVDIQAHQQEKNT